MYNNELIQKLVDVISTSSIELSFALKQATIRRGQASYVFAYKEHAWWIVFNGTSLVPCRNRRGLKAIHYCLSHQGERLSIFQLQDATRTDGDIDPRPMLLESSQDVIDSKAMAEYENRLNDIDEELATATQNADIGLTGKLQQEKQFILDELKRNKGFLCLSRKMVSPAEKERNRMSHLINRELDRIQMQNEELYKHLDSSLHYARGIICYQPNPSVPWVLS